MSSPIAKNFTTPVGRLVQGSLYKPNDKDAEGRPLLVKNGPRTGQPRVEYYVALAIPKVPGQHWASSEWGANIWQVAHSFMPNAGQMAAGAFAFKVKDGDSTVANKKGKRPCDQEGFPGHWVVSFASGFPPKTYSLIGAAQPVEVTQADAINLGDYVQINANVDGNGSQSQPGVFINLGMVCLAGYGQRIVVGPDVASAGFGGAPLPAGASMTPPAGFSPPAPPNSATPAVPGMAPPGAPTMAMPPAPPATAAYGTALPPGLPIPPVPGVPNPGMLAGPGVPQVAVPGAVPMPPAPPMPAPPMVGRQMTAAAQGNTYEAMISRGWTDDTLRANGMMV